MKEWSRKKQIKKGINERDKSREERNRERKGKKKVTVETSQEAICKKAL